MERHRAGRSLETLLTGQAQQSHCAVGWLAAECRSMEAKQTMWRGVNKREKLSIVVLGLCIVALTAIFFLHFV
jgi:hypothetical protein